MRRRQAIKLLGTGAVGGSVLSGTASADVTHPGYGGTAPEWEELYDRGDIDVSSRSTLVINFVSHSLSRGSATWSNLQDVIDHIWDDLYTPLSIDGIRAIWHTWPYIHTHYEGDSRVADSERYQDLAKDLRDQSNYSNYTGPFLFQLASDAIDGASGFTEFGAGSNDPFDHENNDHPVAFAELGTDDRFTMCHELGHCLVNSSATWVDDDHHLASFVDRSANPPKTTLMGYEKEHFESGMCGETYPADHVEDGGDIDYKRQLQFSGCFADGLVDTYREYMYD